MGSPIGSILIYDETNTLVYTQELLSITFDEWPYDELVRVIEPISSMGVNGTRMRLVRSDYPRFIMKAQMDCPNFASAVTSAISLKAFKGYRATMTFNAGGSPISFTDDFYIWELRVKPMSAYTIGPNVSTAGLAMIDIYLEGQFTVAM